MLIRPYFLRSTTIPHNTRSLENIFFSSHLLLNRCASVSRSLFRVHFCPTLYLGQSHKFKPSPRFVVYFSRSNFFSTKTTPVEKESELEPTEDSPVKRQLSKNRLTGIKYLRHNHKVALERALKERKVSVAWEIFEEILKIHSVKHTSTLQLSRLLSLLVKNGEVSAENQKRCQVLVNAMHTLDHHFKSSRELQPLLLYHCKYGTLENAQRTFRLISSMECIPDIYAANIYLDALGKKSANLAFEEFKALLSKGVKPDVFTLSAILRSCRDERDSTLISKVYDVITNLDVQLNNVCYSILIDAYAKSLCPEKAQEIFSSMKRDGVPIDTVTFNTVLNSMAKSGHTEDVLTIYSDLTGSGLKPNLITFNTLLKGIVFGDEFDTKSLEFVRNEMRKYQTHPNQVTYNTLLKGYFLHEDYEKAEQLYHEILTRSQPDVITFNTLIEGYSTISLNRAMEWISEMRKHDIKPNCVTYNTIMNGCLKMNRPEKALEFYSILKKENIPPTSVTYGILINCYGYLKDLDKVAALWSIAVERFPVHTLNGALSAVLDSYGYHSDPSEIRRLWSKLKVKNFPFSENNLSAYIEGLCHLGDVTYSIQVFWAECEQYQLKPSKKTVEIICRFLHKSSATTQLNNFSKRLQNRFPDLYEHLQKKKLVL